LPGYQPLFWTLVYFFSHYLFASNTAHITAMCGAFLATSIAVEPGTSRCAGSRVSRPISAEPVG
jgi:di/tricarboxylate transporter